MWSTIKRAVLLVMLPVLFGYTVPNGCASALREVENLSDPSDDAKLSHCRAEGRAAKQTGSSPEEAYRAYEDCKKDAGLQ